MLVDKASFVLELVSSSLCKLQFSNFWENPVNGYIPSLVEYSDHLKSKLQIEFEETRHDPSKLLMGIQLDEL